MLVFNRGVISICEGLKNLLPTSKLEGHAARMRRALKTLRGLEAKKEPLTSIYSKRKDVLELYLDVYVDDVLKSDIFLVM